MANTTNFNWETPDDTDLVKDGAAAMRTLGNSIDTSFVDLKGGTTGQILSKASNTDLDYTWVTTDDANAIQNAIVDAKGDLIAATAADTPARLAVGTNGQTLVADSTAATGIKWAVASPFIGCYLTKTANQTVSNATMTALTFNTELLDSNTFHDNSTNTSRITIPTGYAGKYLVFGQATFAGSATGIRLIKIIKNGSGDGPDIESGAMAANQTPLTQQFIVDLAVGDYLEMNVYQTSGGNLDVQGDTSGPQKTRFGLTYLGV
jgi:hypothetical protein